MSNDKTLATAKHGGCVQLGDGLPPLPIRQRFTTLHGETYAYSAEQMREYALAALSAQPSPGGQGDVREQFEAWLDTLRLDRSRHGDGYVWNDVELAWRAVEKFAALQPVGELAGYATFRDGRFGSWLFQTRAMAESHDSTAVAGGPGNSDIVPLFRSPAQAVDLDELRRAVCVVNVVGQIDGHDVVYRNSVLDVIDTRRQRLTDSQAVGK